MFTYEANEYGLAVNCLVKNASQTMDALQVDNMLRSMRGELIGE